MIQVIILIQVGMNLSILTKGYVNLEYPKLNQKITYIFPSAKMLVQKLVRRLLLLKLNVRKQEINATRF